MKYSFITNKMLLIIPNNLKDNILKYISSSSNLLDYKIMTKEELKRKFIFDYDENTILYMVKKYNIKPEIAKIYLENIYYLEDKIYKSKKLNELNKMKYDLLENKLLIIDKLFKVYLKQKKVIVYGYDYIDVFYKKMFEQIKDYTNVQIIEKEEFNEKQHKVYEFKTIDEEVEYIAIKIIKLIKSGIDINNIALANVSDEYTNTINRIFNFYNIPINITKPKLSETIIAHKFIEKLGENLNIERTIEELKNEINFQNEDNLNILNQIIDICNNYQIENINNKFIECISYSLNNTNIKQKNLQNQIKIIDIYNNVIENDMYVFLIGFNQGVIPRIYKDEDYISDNLKNEITKETTIEKNKIEKNIIKNIINSIKNLVITFKLKTPFEEYHKSLLIDEMNMEIIKPNLSLNTNYSNISNKLNLAKKLDKLVKFNEIDDSLGILYNTYSNIKYLNYNNKFTKINQKDLQEYLNNKLLLSYSSIDKFYRCKFRYYVNNILKLEKYEETFPIFIGNLFHYILSKAFNTDFNFEKEWNEYLIDKELSQKEKFFLNKLKQELIFIINTIKEQNKFSNLNKSCYEEKIYINKDKNIKITFMGIVDKIMYKEDNGQTIVAIIDYKTGNTETNLNNTIYGIEMQLPVYLYLVKNSKKFSNVKISGFYLQKILNNDVIIPPDKKEEEVKKDALKLSGYSIDNENILKELDFSYKNSEIIKSLKVGNNGFYSYSKVISEDKIKQLIDIVDKKIDEAINNIINADFEINPKRIGNINKGCEFCNFKDLCFMNEKDFVNLEEHKNLDFLNIE